VDRLANLYEQGRRFEVFELVDNGDAVVAGLRVSQPDWSGSVDVFKRFTFRQGTDVVVHMEDCTDRDDALGRSGG
jgi:hypothetical protein